MLFEVLNEPTPAAKAILMNYDPEGRGLVPLHAADHAARALGARGMTVQVTPIEQAVLKANAWHCTTEGLYPHQRTGAEFLHARRRALLGDEMGTGKTATLLAAIPQDKGVLLLCPPALLSNWQKEAQRWRPDLMCRVHRPPYSVFPEPGEIRLLSYSRIATSLDGVIGAKREAPAPFIFAADEAHYLKNPQAQRSSGAKELAESADVHWLLTGTPLLNKPPDLWGLLCTAEAATDTFFSWDKFLTLFSATNKYFWKTDYQGKKIRQFGGYEFHEAKPEASARLSTIMLRRTREEVLPELPEKTYREYEVPTHFRGSDLPEFECWEDDTVLYECGPDGLLSSDRKALAESKIDALQSLIETYEEAAEPLVVFSAHVAPIEALRARKGWNVITGATPVVERAASIEAFQVGKLRGIAGTIGAMGVGITLTRASQVIFVDRSYVPADNLQAEDRVLRIGQKSAVVITTLVANHPVDRRVAEVLAKKEKILREMKL